VQAVEQLPLVLVDPLHVHVEHGVGVDLHLVVLLQVGGELHLVLLRGARRDETRAPGYYRRAWTTLDHDTLPGSIAVSFTHLFDFGNVADEGIVVHKLEKVLELVQVSDVIVTDSLTIGHIDKRIGLYIVNVGTA